MRKKFRQRKCKVCREWYTPFNSLQPICTNPRCALEWVRQKRAKEYRKETRRLKKKVETLAECCSKAQRDVNRYIVLRDKDKGCISCGGPVVDAGHMIHAGSKYRTSRLRFAHINIHGQCKKCNSFVGGGNRVEYERGIVERYGQDYLDEIYELKRKADQGELEPLTKDEVREIAKEHRRMVRDMKRNAK